MKVLEKYEEFLSKYKEGVECMYVLKYKVNVKMWYNNAKCAEAKKK